MIEYYVSLNLDKRRKEFNEESGKFASNEDVLYFLLLQQSRSYEDGYEQGLIDAKKTK